MAEASPSNGTGTWGQGMCFGVPFQWFSLLNGQQRQQQPSVVRCYASLSRIGPCIARSGPAAVVSDGVAGAILGLVVAETLIPDAANDLGGNIPYFPLQWKAHIGSAGEG